jgi:23S rRNA pseudouridine955/2504/2580 synthase
MKPIRRLSESENICYQDENILAFNKPAGVYSLPSRNREGLDMLNWGRSIFPELMLCHRIDRDTSGLLLAALSVDTHRYINGLFAKRKMTKIYHAVVPGPTNYEYVEINQALSPDGHTRMKIDRQHGKPAITVFKTLGNYGDFSLIECRPLTGRLHQIRVHLAYLKTPIYGDLLYGGKWAYLSSLKRGYKPPRWEEEKPIIQRMALHAYSLNFNDMEGRAMEIVAPYPKDFEIFVKQMKKYKASTWNY